ncbi:MAG: response regulator [Alphaproteobacteria bacterium]|nr:response regulator [Alphaproteobacteria bacterium]MBU0796410.1 response regulator [Alphaproteobacteria bacterium]MBU0886761.1 response regulator [Alphaproteobacteria bacterium]MBU1812626.1 response regulator [Alphaproteobacteria bacterium]MBU2089046.1 response regulator [Alphaproteobacteria bacterium]
MAKSGRYSGSIIVVDDDVEMRGYVKAVLESIGYTVFPAVDGFACMRLLASVTPSAILLDVAMPGMDGYETCRRIRSMRPDLNCPIIFLTARKSMEDVQMARDVGGNHFLLKPIVPEKLVSRLLHFMGREMAP